ncbi:hypothetical protein [Tabrizicola sp.]|uniref:hypothetical protein n=1 Tax=Tabrizicola sp. TaxID=2005166 RepID=UPI0035B0E85A
MFTTNIVILAAIILVAGLMMFRATRAYNTQRASLSADEARTFDSLIRQSRAELPSRFTTLAASADRARRTYLLGMLAILAGIVFVIIAGP